MGCGTGILSLFASSAGARVVYSVDSSDIILQAKQIVIDNGFTGKVICIQGKVQPNRSKNCLTCQRWKRLSCLRRLTSSLANGWAISFFMKPCCPLCCSPETSGWYVTDTFMSKPLKKEDGILMPDQANIYVSFIEDADYKDEKIKCMLLH